MNKFLYNNPVGRFFFVIYLYFTMICFICYDFFRKTERWHETYTARTDYEDIHQELLNADPNTLNEFQKCLLRDWGKPDVYCYLWTKDAQPTEADQFHFYKSYYLITTNDKSPEIDKFKE